jgi:methionyl-tRNA synthetase
MARFKKLTGYDTYFLTGTDEHGQKIEKKATAQGMTPQAYVDRIVAGIKDLWKLMDIEYDDFIRTTDERHVTTVQKIFKQLYEQGDIYKAEYEGWYCTPCEAFWTDTQAKDGLCPDCGRPVERAKESAYFFRLSKYQDALIDLFENHPDFLQPESRRNEMLSFCRQGLEDLCISRSSFDWGIPVPVEEGHVIYVWLDALSNYITALGWPDEPEKYERYWPADIHLVGKEIVRFHTIYWPIMLHALGLPLPKQVFAHGWLLFGNDKMSKSKGNVVDPRVLVKKYSVDAIRYFLMKEMAYGQDATYSEESLAMRINTDLANDYGNLLSRATGMIAKFQDSVVLAPGEPTEFDEELIALAKETPENFGRLMDEMKWQDALNELWKLVNKANKYIDDAAPWKLNKAGETAKLSSVLYNMVEVVRFVTVMISPVMPSTPEKVWQQLGISDRKDLHTWESLTWGAYPIGNKIDRGEPLFPRIDIDALDDMPIAGSEPKATAEPEKPACEPVADSITIDDFAKVDIRVVKVLECTKVPKADRLLQFEIEIAGEEFTVLSGIAQWYKPEELVGKKLLWCANLAPRKIRGIESRGMLMSVVQGDDLAVVEAPDLPTGSKLC